MKNSIKSLIAAGIAAFVFYAHTPAIAEQPPKSIVEEYQLINKYYELKKQKEKISSELDKIQSKIKEKKIPVEYFKNYGTELKLEDYLRIIQIAQENNLKENSYQRFINLERVLDFEEFMDRVSSHYDISKQDIIMLWNQESTFDIKRIGSHGERGLAQFREMIGRLIFYRMVSPGDILYFDWAKLYPEFDTKKYSFEQLSKDYKLNAAMTAAQLHLTQILLENNLKKMNLNLKQLAGIIRNKGMHSNFNQLRIASQNPSSFNLTKDLENTIKNYVISDKRVKEVNKIYRENGVLLKTALKYIIHNGGPGAVQNITSNSVIGEILLYHLALYIKNLGGISELMNHHYGSLENLVKAHKSEIINLKTGKTLDVWGNEIQRIDIQQLKKYSQHGLIIKVSPEIFKQNQITKVNDYIINEDLSLKLLDKNIAPLLSAVEDIDQKYEQLTMFKQLEEVQNYLNEAWAANDKKGMSSYGIKVTQLEQEINKKFNMQRAHTGIKGIQSDIAKLEKEIIDSGFQPDIEKYKLMKGY